MSSKFLPVTRANADYVIEETKSLLKNGPVDMDRILMICKNFRQRAICSLFLEAAAKTFHDDLQKSGTAFLHVLRKTPNESKVTSKQAPFYDAIACGDYETARQIAELSRTTFNADEEYEDDFLYVMILMKKFFLKAPENELTALLDRYKSLAEDSDDRRVDICAAYIENNADQFEETLNALIKTRAFEFKEGFISEQILEEDYSTEGKLFVEGLALLRLAHKLNFPTQKNYKFIPSLIIETQATSFNGDSWRTEAT